MTTPAGRPLVASLRLEPDCIVHALFDGGLAGADTDYNGIAPDRLESALRGAGQSYPPRPDLLCYLIETAGQRILADAGAGEHYGPEAGTLPQALAALGLTAAAIDAIVLTHCHGDHVGGLIDTAGAPTFPRATLHLSRTEAHYWLESPPETIPQARHRTRDFARRSLAPYAGRIEERGDEDIIGPGVALVPLPGHSPGHSGLAIGGAEPKLIIAGDLLHLPEVQLGSAEVTTRYDWRQDLAASSRRQLLGRAAREQILLAGMHFRWPGFCRVEESEGGFRLLPVATTG